MGESTEAASAAAYDDVRNPSCINCGKPITDENEPCYGHPDATPEWPVFHTEPA